MTPNKAVFRIRDGFVEALAGGPLSLAQLGPRTTKRASTLEHNATKDVWEVRVDGQVLHQDADYDKALQWERDYFNQKLASA